LVVNLQIHPMQKPSATPPEGGEGGGRKEGLLAWDRQYREKGRIWRGAPAKLPYLPAVSRVLELGCGNGKTLAAMLRRPWRVAALDLSPLAVRFGGEIAASLQGAPSQADLLVADVASLPFQDDTFDAVFAFHVLGHLLVRDRRRAAAEAARVLKGGGRLFFLEFGVDDMRAGKGVEVEPMTFKRGGGVTTHYFSEGEVLGLFDILSPVSVSTDRRLSRIMGLDHIRADVEAEFIKQKD